MQGIHDLGEVLNEASIVSNECDETLDGHIHHGFGIFGDDFQTMPAWPHAF